MIAVTCDLCKAQTKQTTGESNLTTGRIAARWCRFAPHLLPLTHPGPNPKRHLDWFSSFCTARSTKSLYFTMGHPSSLEIAASHGGIWTLCNTLFFGPIRTHNQNGISIGSAVFAQLTADCPVVYSGLLLPPHNCPFPWGDLDPSNTWFRGPIRVLNPNGISVCSAIFAELTTVTD